ncbi:AsmA family protein [bacterium]|nr:AsmA family protein [bacterium]
MKRIIKISGITILSILVLIYAAFMFILPNVVKIEKYKPDLQKIVKEQTNLLFDFDNAKISVTPMLSAGLSANNISIKLPDESDFVSADSLIARISIPHLLFKTIKVTKAELVNPVINVDIADNKEYKAVTVISQALENKAEKEEEQTTQQTQNFDISSIKINIPEIKIVNYAALINDLQTGDYLKLRGDELLIGYNGQNASLKTIAELFVNDSKNIIANIDINSVIPEFIQNDDSQSKKENDKNELPFINPVAVYKAYDLKTNIDATLKIRQKNDIYVSNGHINIDNLSLKLDGMQLPESKLHIATQGTKANIDSDIFVAEQEKLSLLGSLEYGKNPQTDIVIKSNEIHTNNLINLVHAALNSANIKNELDTIKGTGFLTADAKVKTDFKDLESNGNITINNCELTNSKDNSRIAKINSVIALDNNVLEFVNTTVEVLDTIFKVSGTINEKSIADISVITEKLPVQRLINLFAPADIKNTYLVNSGALNINADVKGELSAPSGTLKLTLNNLSLTDKINKINYLNNILVADFTSDFKTYKGTLKNNDFRLSMNGVGVNCDSLNVNVDDKNITIDPAKLRINNSTDINFSGDIKNYINNPIFNIIANGSVRTQDLKQLLGSDISPYIANKGTLPLDIKINGDSKEQTLIASVIADGNNYITPFNITNLLNKKSELKLAVDLKGDKLTIRDTGLYVNGTDKSTEIASVEGTIVKLNTKTPSINMIKVKVPEEITGSIAVFPKSKASAKGNLYVSGELNNPKLRGSFDIWNLSIPEILVTMEKAVANIEGNALDVNINKLLANGSDYNLVINADLTPSQYFTIKNLNVISNFTDADKVMKVTEALDKALPKAASSSGSSKSSSSSDMPVIIKDGTIDMKEIKSGTMTLTETTGKISLAKNIFYINNLITSIFKGKVKGDVSMNLISSDIKANVKGSGLDVEKTLLDAAAMKDTLTGTMDFDADISLKGSSYEEQMKSLKGKVNFTMKNGTLGPFGRIENLIIADNIRQNAFFKTALGTTINQITKFDTTHFNSLTGNMSFNNGIAQINPITSSGDVMSTYIFGNFDLLKNNIDVTLRGRLGSQVSESMGTLSMINPINLSKKATTINPLLGNIFVIFTQQVTDSEMAQIPKLGKDYSDTNTTRFQAILKGDVAKPNSVVKSFKWLALKSEIESAQTALGAANLGITSLNKEEVKNAAKKKLVESVNSSMTEEQKKQLQQTQDTVKAVKSLVNNKEEVKNAVKEQAKQAKSNFLNQLKEQAKQAVSVPAEGTGEQSQ